MVTEQVGYLLDADGGDQVFCMDHRPAGANYPVWSGGLGAAMACESCGRRLDGAPESPLDAAQVEAEVRRLASERDE
jgi:hypothetical protein